MSILLLNNFNGIDGATTLVDQVGSKTWTRPYGGGGELDTAQKKWGLSSLMCVGTANAWLRGGSFASPYAGDFTAETWFRSTSTDAAVSVYLTDPATSNGLEFGIYLSGTWTWFLNAYDSGGGTIFEVSGTPTLSVDTWYHLAACRNSAAGTYELFFNGARLTSQSSATNVRSFGSVDLLGPGAASTTWYDDVRVTNTVAYSGATYTIPSAEFALPVDAVAATRPTITLNAKVATIIAGEGVLATRAAVGVQGRAASFLDPVVPYPALIRVIGFQANFQQPITLKSRPATVPLVLLPQLGGKDWRADGARLASALANGMQTMSGQAGSIAALVYPPGTRKAFCNPAVPLGWQLDASAMDRVLRVVAGNGGGTGGSWTVGGLSAANTLLGVAQIPGHLHGLTLSTVTHTHAVSMQATGGHDHSATSSTFSHTHLSELVLGGGHQHTFTGTNTAAGGAHSGFANTPGNTADTGATGPGGAHVHTTISVIAAGAHLHVLIPPSSTHSHSVTLAVAGSHAHTVVLDYIGGDQPHKHPVASDGSWRPSYLDVVLGVKLPVT